MKLKNGILFLIFFTIAVNAVAQNPYVLNGSATQDNCHCYTLTREIVNQSGSIWNKNKIDISQPFDFFFNVNLGCIDANGADGIAFVLQPISTSLGSTGQGLGFGGIVPSLGVTIDTYQNFDDNDPYYDHVAIQANGDVNHSSPNNLAGPIVALANSDNIEDCKFHVLEVNWKPSVDSMIISLDGVVRLNLQKDIIKDIFNNDPMVFWGFTSSTGGSVNMQQMCTSLDAKFTLAPHTNTCIGTPLTFIDSSVSFGSISNWIWNFGDGTTYSQKTPPSHTYANPGVYNVSLNVLSGDGCTSDTFKQQITVGTYPVADFKTSIDPICTNRAVTFTDATTLAVGTENYWYWNFGDGTTSYIQNPPPKKFTVGNYDVQFYVKTLEGCESDVVTKNFTVKQAPDIDFTKADACKNTPVNFVATDLNNTIGIKQWYWNFGDNNFSTEQNPTHIYDEKNSYTVALVGTADNGCLTDTIIKTLNVYGTNAYAGRDTTILQGYPFQLNATGGDSYIWTPTIGLNNPFIANPIATLNNDVTYVVTASTIQGCATTDSIILKVVKGPEIYVPTAFSPNGDGLNDKFKIIPVGITEIAYFNVYNRWGQLIFSTKNALQGWDGNVNGIPQPAGTYIWVVVGKSSLDGASLKKQGTVVLVR